MARSAVALQVDCLQTLVTQTPTRWPQDSRQTERNSENNDAAG